MKIEKIKILKNKAVIYLDKDSKLELDKDVYPNFYLYVGKELSNKEIKEIKEQNEMASLNKYALNLRAKRLLSEYQLREKLYLKGASKPVVDRIIKNLKTYDLIDDNAFILEHIEYYNSLNYGENKIKEKLMSKGIFSDKLDKINFPISIEKRKAKAIFNKLNNKYDKYNVSQKRNHIYNAYISNGFSGEIASEMMNLIKEDNHKNELDKLKKDYDKTKIRLSRKYDKKELKQKIIQSLLTKGYKLNDIIKVIER